MSAARAAGSGIPCLPAQMQRNAGWNFETDSLLRTGSTGDTVEATP
ncbi:MAG: hypothetical protein ABSA39_17590 [Edaphobacter sp.]